MRVYHSYFSWFLRSDYSAPFGNIYVSPELPTSTYENLPGTPLVHELAHVWQWQARGRNSFSLIHLGYDYRLEDGKTFEDYGLEQQAEIIADYWSIRNGGYLLKWDGSEYGPKDVPRFEALIPFLAAE